MIEILRNIGNLRYSCLKKSIFHFEWSHYFFKLLHCDRTITCIHFCPFLSHFLLTLLISKDDFTQLLDIAGLLFFIYGLGFSNKFLHFFHKLFGSKTLLTCGFISIEKIDDY